MNVAKSSFTSADSFPVKLLQNHKLIRSITEDKIIPPAHIQLIPTNKCNLACKFCSCAKEDRNSEMSRIDLAKTINMMADELTDSVTITGGGEPLMFPFFSDMMDMLQYEGIKSGLVTNGILLPYADIRALKYLTWCRISYGDDREHWSQNFKDSMEYTVRQLPHVDWALSYVVSLEPDIDKLMGILRFSDYLGFTHVRIVADLMHPEDVPMEYVKQQLDTVLCSIKTPVLFQDRQKPELGSDCYICYLKPVITPDLKVYACCGAQYALDVPSQKFPEELCIGSVDTLSEIIRSHSRRPFDGSKHCKRCYYGNYNRALKALITDLQHQEFV